MLPDDPQHDDTEIVEIVDGEITEQMRAAYERFWQLLIGRVSNDIELKDGSEPPDPNKGNKRRTKKSKAKTRRLGAPKSL